MYPQNRRELRSCYSRAAWALMAYLVLMELFIYLSYIPYFLGAYDLYYSVGYDEAVNAVIVFFPGIIAFGLVLRPLPKPRIHGKPPKAKDVIVCLIVAMGFLYIASTVTDFLLAGTETVDYANESVAEEPFYMALIFTVIIAPLSEEFLFRKLLLDRLLFLGDWSALLVSALFFGLFHTNLYQFLYATAVGLVMGYVHIMTGKMRWNVGLHMFINLFCGVLIGYLPDYDWVWILVELFIFFTMIFAIIYVLIKRPWRRFYSGPMAKVTPGEKRIACFTSVPLWVCIVVHLGLSVYYIRI